MQRKLIVATNVILLSIQNITPQYNEPTIDEVPQSFQYNPYNFMGDSFKQYPNQQYLYNQWNIPDKNYEEYNDYVETNRCSCENCNDLKPSCRNMCPNCVPMPPLQPYFYQQYPYPYSIPETPEPQEELETPVSTTATTEEIANTSKAPTTKVSTTTELTTESETTTDLTLSSIFEKAKDFDTITKSFHVKDRNPYIMTSIRRTRPNWIPKYGVVPISDQFAEKLMLKLRSMKVLHPRKDNFREVDEIKSLN